MLDKLYQAKLINVNSEIDQYESRTIHLAAKLYDNTLINLLLKNGANINVIDINGNTPLHVLVQALNDCDINNNNNLKTDKFQKIIKCLNSMIIYLNKYNGKTDIKQINFLNTQNNFGKTVLHYAVINANNMNVDYVLEIIGQFIDNEIDVDIEDSNHKTALYYILDKHDVRQLQTIIDKLLAAKCDTLNIYEVHGLPHQYRQQFMSLKNMCRTYLSRTYPTVVTSNLIHKLELPNELNVFCRKKLVKF
ncbi:E3 ubiquitin-protein ligase HACE1-like [Oppia nitens]|uniref:E3 ubiquitin-protein ligase HACE1-like n=1 Tax=Oppia nitens TaxID=1686743 RepID=UPI0023DB1FBE|nr:E3 ubiquitin-protein ligase HACE1-like [Oppia nitens]